MENWKDNILNERERLSPDSEFKYSCHNGVACFGKCCGDVNIFLTPYDVLRMKKALDLSSEEFLGKYTLSLILQDQNIPVALLKMGEDEDKRCPFVTAEGCSIYQDRPWACRMYPLGLASSKTETETEGEEFCFMADDESLCLGFREDKEWTVKGWLTDQGVDIYNQKSQAYMQFTLNKSFQEGKELVPAKVQMFYQTCYNLDKFRTNLFESSFFERFDIEEATIERLKTDDEALLDFGIKWLRFSLFAENTLKVKDEVWDTMKNDLGSITE
ncbi:YkgJ family cysteine cluster protein [Chloroflexota bacterium]